MPSYPQNATGGVWECRILDEKRHSAGSNSAHRLVFCCCARDVVAFFTKDGIEWEKPGCVAMKLSIKVIVALLNCRAANLGADSRIAFRLPQAKKPDDGRSSDFGVKGGEKKGRFSRHRGFCSARELLCWGSLLLRQRTAPSAIPLRHLRAALLENYPVSQRSCIAGISSRISGKRLLRQRLRRKRFCYLARRPSSSM